ncbi:hypothetical protein WMF04_12830 [Sorangium sp. So ce260]|uniref:hypothetical protein n=1 Tax=Sorangium sp. So ce260 TaxID=3133291 RepID=UPI003F62E7B5
MFHLKKSRHINDLCTKMVTLEAPLDAGAVFDRISIVELARGSHSILTRSPELKDCRRSAARALPGRAHQVR